MSNTANTAEPGKTGAVTLRRRVEAELRRRAAPARAEHPLSYGQRSMWLLHRVDPAGASYHISFAARVRGAVDGGALHAALRSLAGRHEALRTTFAERDGDVRQVVHGWLEPGWQETDATAWDTDRLDAEVRAAYRQPFDGEHGPLFRAALFRTGADDAVLLLVVHHLVADFWSLELLIDELGTLYAGERDGTDTRLPEGNAPYRSFVAWQERFLAGEQGARAAAYWHDRLAGELDIVDWPRFRVEPDADPAAGASEFFRLDDELAKRVFAFARQENTTPYIVQLTAYQALVARYTGQDDVLVGMPVSGRTDPSFRGSVGYLADPVVLRGDLSDEPSFMELMRRTRTAVTEALEHHYPFERLVEELAPRRMPGVNPVFQTLFVYQKPQRLPGLAALHWGAEPGADAPAVPWAGLRLLPHRLPQQEGQLDLMLEVAEDGERLLGTLKYRPAVFSAGAARGVIEHYTALLRAALDDPRTAVASLPPATGSGVPRAAGAAAEPVLDADDSLLRRFATVAGTHADRPAVRHEGTELTYRQLDGLGERWAGALRAVGTRHGDRVAHLLAPSPETVVALVGTVKAGAAAVCLDPHHPPTRLRAMLADCGATTVLTTRALAPLLDGADARVRFLYMDDSADDALDTRDVSEPPALTPDDLLYTVYTSGSTGTPKGIDVEHRNVLSLLDAMREHVEPDPEAVWCLFHSTAFDLSVWEHWGSLLSGACLVVVGAETARAPDALRRLLVAEGVTHLTQTPSALHGLAAEVAAHGAGGLRLRHTFSCGELLSAGTARSALDWCGTLWNCYGPAETTVWVTAQRVRAEDCRGASVPVGGPLANAALYVLDTHGRTVPAEVTGELYIGGQAVARGYVNRPRLLAERYLPDPFTGGAARMYRSGDLARVDADGLVEILGRADNQVKVSGYRIELEEIEAALDRVPGVDRSVVVVEGTGPGTHSLTACVVPARPGAAPAEAELRAALQDALPPYMVPTSFVFPDRLPLNVNQKTDRSAVARLVEAERARQLPRHSAAPAAGSRMERAVAEVWRRVLRRDGIGRGDNFFEVGGTSMLLLQVHQQLREIPGAAPVAVSELFAYPTVAAQAGRLAPAAAARPAGPEGQGGRRAALRKAAARGGPQAALRRGHRARRDEAAGGDHE
ncbi:amino acid adenylation domain-containing protein [Streptomyces sp. NPDC050732]|uniref:non-ribosomal peptide synthetase n=1 Tax=Streptomyces sp. NPDC050732 TaxID=3154632 RepID=UPI00342AF115